MYESEANLIQESVDQIPADVQARFRELSGSILTRTLMPWGEHCTECVWPTCYTSCDLYSPREDKRCRRFVNGMVRLDCPGTPNSYLLKIEFKRWGKLWSPGNVRLYPMTEAQTIERRDRAVGVLLQRLPVPSVAKRLATGMRYDFKKRAAQNEPPSGAFPTSLVVECYNPGASAVSISLTLRATGNPEAVPFQQLLNATPGFARFQIPVVQIPASLLRSQFEMELVPNDITDGTALYFGLIDFVSEKPSTAAASVAAPKTIKCVVWDLDHTMWDGILVEDGAERLTLKPGVGDVIRELDRRGILHSIASKNNHDEAWQVLKRFGLDEYFLVPQISWLPKSEGVAAIAAKLNIGIDSLLFIDDSPFELEEVMAACAGVRVLSASEYLSLPDRPECRVPVTEEAAMRRKLYKEDSLRVETASAFGDDYLAFLKQCGLELTIKPLALDNIERAHELTQRTNQMNFSGTRYTHALLEEIRRNPDFDTYVLSCRDRFGSYGVIGFSVVNRREPRMTDLMFSCRVQSKRVEHAFLSWLFSRHAGGTRRDFWANYRKTSRNAPSGRVFADVGMEEHGVNDGVTSLVFRKERPIPDDGIVTIKSECPSLELSRT